MKSKTTLYGQLLSIDNKTANLVLINGQAINCVIAKSNRTAIRERLEQRIDTEIGVTGLATWDLHDMSITAFQIDELLSYEKTPISEALSNLYELIGSHLEAIEDLEQFFED